MNLLQPSGMLLLWQLITDCKLSFQKVRCSGFSHRNHSHTSSRICGNEHWRSHTSGEAVLLSREGKERQDQDLCLCERVIDFFPPIWAEMSLTQADMTTLYRLVVKSDGALCHLHKKLYEGHKCDLVWESCFTPELQQCYSYRKPKRMFYSFQSLLWVEECDIKTKSGPQNTTFGTCLDHAILVGWNKLWLLNTKALAPVLTF